MGIKKKEIPVLIVMIILARNSFLINNKVVNVKYVNQDMEEIIKHPTNKDYV